MTLEHRNDKSEILNFSLYKIKNVLSHARIEKKIKGWVAANASYQTIALDTPSNPINNTYYTKSIQH